MRKGFFILLLTSSRRALAAADAACPPRPDPDAPYLARMASLQ
jgi:hypothetical protein